MTSLLEPSAGIPVTRSWKTGVIIAQSDVAGVLSHDAAPKGAGRCTTIPEAAVPGLTLLREQFLTSMNALAAADGSALVTGCSIEVQAWQGGYDEPAFSRQARYIGWTVLAASGPPQHSESGCLAFADPRAGSAGTAMPGLPWGRQFVVITRPGTHAVVPGWLTCSVVPLERGQHLTVAVAVSLD
jgi:hypothetical protein